MTATARSRRAWGGGRDEEGHRTWTLKSYVECSSKQDGPFTVMQCSGLPQVGDTWAFGNDLDVWAFCYPEMKINQLDQKDGQASTHWEVEQTFSTKPLKRCNTTQIENPLSEPMKISGSFVKYTKEIVRDMYGFPVLSSSFERLHGPAVEFDFNRATVKIEQNVPYLGLETFSLYVDTVNDSTLWGLPPRCVKLSNVQWERKLWGVCNYYYTRAFEFDIDFMTFDRQVLDEGHKCLNGMWTTSDDPALLTYRNGVPLPPGSLWKLMPINGVSPDRKNPQHYTYYMDRNSQPGRVILDGSGEPASLGPQSISNGTAGAGGGAGATGVAGANPPWAPNQAYQVGNLVSNDSKYYKCTIEGTSANSGGPTGTSGNIVDNTCLWMYMADPTTGAVPGTASSGGGHGEPGKRFVQHYQQTNLLVLGIPSSL